jgi:lysozyme family protein
MPTISDIIDDIIVREGPPTNDPTDAGGRTAYGISERANPEAWADNKVTEAEAREIYLRKYVRWPRFDQITDSDLQAQLVDFGVNSGPMIATKKLQEIVGTDQDGVIGPATLTALSIMNVALVNNELVKSRLKMICRIVQKNPSQIKYLLGWVNRALEFLK